MKSIDDIIRIKEDAEKVEVIGTNENGLKLVTFEDLVKLQQRDMVNGENELNTMTMNPDGTVARPHVLYAAVNPDALFCNRFRQRGKGIDVVRDYRAIKDLTAYAQIYTRQIFAYHLERDKAGKLTCKELLYVTDEEFQKDFRDTLDYNAMREVLGAIAGQEEQKMRQVALPI